MRNLIIYKNADNPSQKALYDGEAERLVVSGSDRYNIDDVIKGVMLGMVFLTDERVRTVNVDIAQKENPKLYEDLFFEN